MARTSLRTLRWVEANEIPAVETWTTEKGREQDKKKIM
jgi:hypothetical protein